MMDIKPWFKMSHNDFDAKRKLLGLFPDYTVEYVNPLVITLHRVGDRGYSIHLSILHPILRPTDLKFENIEMWDYYNISNSKLMEFEPDIDGLIVIHFNMNVILKLLDLI